MTEQPTQPDPALVEQVQAREQALLNQTITAHLQQRVVELGVELAEARDAYQQLARLVTNDQQPETSAGAGEDGDA